MPRRLVGLLIASTLFAAPAVALRLACIGSSCGSPAPAQARVPFCPLPDRLKGLIAAGYRDGRSPEVLVVPTSPQISGGTSPNTTGVPWPGTSPLPDTSVPIVFTGPRVKHVPLQAGTGLDQIAPTLAGFLHFNREHPEVRAGQAIPGLDARGLSPSLVPRLVLELIWTGVSGDELRALPHSRTPWLRSQVGSGAGTFAGDTGSVPLDPAAILTTIGTGGLPFQHGITGSLLRSPSGGVVPAWGKGAPTSVIATLTEDLDQAKGQAPKIALVAPASEDQGLIGGKWYLGHDKDLVDIGGDPVANARAALATGLGSDATPDVLGVVLQGTPRQMDQESAAIQRLAVRAAGGQAGLITATAGTGASIDPLVTGAEVAAVVDGALGVPIVTASTPGGLFLDAAVQAKAHISGQDVVDSLLPIGSNTPSTAPRRRLTFADAFQGFAVAFRRYC